MDCIESWSWAPEAWSPEAVPEVDDVRPKRCERCKHVARNDGRIYLHGHGVRLREVVAPGLNESFGRRMVECWMRRYRCTLCCKVMVVRPRGVLGRFVYSVGAIVSALFLVAEPPVGDGLTDEAAYRRQGQKRRPTWTDASPYRWRSLDRWSSLAGRWWPDSTLGGLPSLLVSFRSRAGAHERPAALEAAITAHVHWGSTV